MRGCITLLLAVAHAAPFSTFRLASIFSEHLILQRAPATARVWGWTRPLSQVSAHLNCSAAGGDVWSGNVTSDADGLWVVQYPAQRASHGGACYASFTDSASLNSVWFLDVKFGEILLCLGRACFFGHCSPSCNTLLTPSHPLPHP